MACAFPSYVKKHPKTKKSVCPPEETCKKNVCVPKKSRKKTMKTTKTNATTQTTPEAKKHVKSSVTFSTQTEDSFIHTQHRLTTRKRKPPFKELNPQVKRAKPDPPATQKRKPPFKEINPHVKRAKLNSPAARKRKMTEAQSLLSSRAKTDIDKRRKSRRILVNKLKKVDSQYTPKPPGALRESRRILEKKIL